MLSATLNHRKQKTTGTRELEEKGNHKGSLLWLRHPHMNVRTILVWASLWLCPEDDAVFEGIGEAFFDGSFQMRDVVTRAEVGEQDQFVFEAVRSFENVVQMRVAELMNLLLTVLRAEERHFSNENLGSVHIGMRIQSRGRGVSQISDDRHANFVRHIFARQSQVANFLVR